MPTIIASFPGSQRFGRGLLLGGVAVLLIALPRPALSQQSISFH